MALPDHAPQSRLGPLQVGSGDHDPEGRPNQSPDPGAGVGELAEGESTGRALSDRMRDEFLRLLNLRSAEGR